MAGGPHQPAQLAGADNRRVVRRHRPQPRTRGDQLELRHLGQHLVRSLEQAEHAVGGHGRVEAQLFGRGADHHPPICARDHVTAGRPYQARRRRLEPTAHTQLQQLPLHRPDRRGGGLRGQLTLGAPRAGRHEHGGGADVRAASRAHTGYGAVRGAQSADLHAGEQLAPRGAQRGVERRLPPRADRHDRPGEPGSRR